MKCFLSYLRHCAFTANPKEITVNNGQLLLLDESLTVLLVLADIIKLHCV